MNEKTIKRYNNIGMWAKRVEDQKVSGLSIVEWCVKNHVSESQFHYWKRVCENTTGEQRNSFAIDDEMYEKVCDYAKNHDMVYTSGKNRTGKMRSEFVIKWMDRLREQRASGVNILTWCKSNGILPSNFFHWRKYIREMVAKINSGELAIIKEETPVAEEIAVSEIQDVISEEIQDVTVSDSGEMITIEDNKIIVRIGSLEIEFVGVPQVVQFVKQLQFA